MTPDRLDVVVVAGGTSAEREVSLRSGANVTETLAGLGHRVEMLDVDAGLWSRLTADPPDVVFIALHGRGGEDGSIQGALELLGVPYTGSGVLASALCMDKAVAKTLLRAAGVATPDWQVVEDPQGADPETIAALAVKLGFPLVVKPVREGSTIGLTVARDLDAVKNGVELAARHDRRVLLETLVEGTEVTIGVLGGNPARALPSLEIVTERALYDYEAKYTVGGSAHIIPARITSAQAEACTAMAVAAHRILGCEGMSRVDLMVPPTGSPQLLEVNTVPGMTALSLLPDAARAAGIEFPELVEILVRDGLERARHRRVAASR